MLQLRLGLLAAWALVPCALIGFSDRAQGEPSFDDLIVWLSADRDVETVEGGTAVVGWSDQAEVDILHHGTAVGTPQLVSSRFPSGFLPAIRFNGSTDGILLENGEDIFLSEMTIHIVVNNVDMSRVAQCMFANYRDVSGFGVGISDGVPGRLKWFTAHPIESLEQPEANLQLDTAHVITVSLTSDGRKTARIDGVEVGTSAPGGVSYDAPTFHQLTVGYLQNNRQWFGGDIAELIVYSFDEPDRTLDVEDYLLEKYMTARAGPPVIEVQPQSQTVVQGETVAFSVGAVGQSPLTYEWLKNGEVIPFAFKSSYSVLNVDLVDNGAEYSVRVSNDLGSETSETATLTVLESLDDTPPTIETVRREVFENSVLVTFSEAVRTEDAADAANYAIDNGVTVDNATPLESGDVVRLNTTSALTHGTDYTLTVNGIQDIAGNPIAADSRALITIPADTEGPPQEDLKCWFLADAGINLSEDNSTVLGWSDQAGADTVLNSGTAVGEPQLTMANFPAGPRSVVRFDGINDGILLENEMDLNVNPLSIFVVVHNVDTSRASQCIAANYANVAGFGLGLSDGVAGRVKWFTAHAIDSLEPDPGGNLEAEAAYYLAATLDSDGIKNLRINGELVGESVPGGISYDAFGMRLTLGYLFGIGQWFGGDIAEVLVYSASKEELTELVEDYLAERYLVPSSSAPKFIANPLDQTVSEGHSAEFSVILSGKTPFSYRWMRNGITIDGETEPTYLIQHVTRDRDGDRISVEVTNEFGFATSGEALVTVIDLDDVLPIIESARRNRLTNTAVKIRFSERVLESTAVVTGNYAIDNGVTVNEASLSDDGTTVTLTTTPILSENVYILTVNNVADVVGNVVAAGSRLAITIPDDTILLPPEDGLELWLDAGAGVETQAGLVTQWSDLSPGDVQQNGTVQGTPEVEQFDFPNGDTLPVLRFDGDDGFLLENDDGLFLGELSIYAVASFDTTVQSRLLIANYVDVSGFGLGISDAFPGRVKWFTANPVDSLEPTPGGDLVHNAPTLITATMDGVEKILYVNGEEAGRTQPGGINYSGENQLTVGFSPTAGGQFLVGNIAEILVYSSVDLEQREEVEEYLRDKYFEEKNPVDPGTLFRRGDCDQSGKADFNDAIFHLRFLFLGDNSETVESCPDACDTDDSGEDDFTDDINLLKFLFLGQGTIPTPGPLPDESHPCGTDLTLETPEELPCTSYSPAIGCP